MTYVYDGDNVSGHSVLGLKIRMARAVPDVRFEVDQIDDLAKLPERDRLGPLREVVIRADTAIDEPRAGSTRSGASAALRIT